MFEIAIYADTDDERVAYVTLPANKNMIVDAMDRERIFGRTSTHITECRDFPELLDVEFDEPPTLDELNFLAKRLEEISADTSEKYAYRALLKKPMETVNEAINRTYNLQTIPVYPCTGYAEYGEIVLDNDLLEELRDIPDEVFALLDAAKVGRAMAEREGGVFIDGYYAVADSYDPALVYDEQLPEPPEDWLFRLEVAGIPEKDEDVYKMKTETLMLPADEDLMQDIAEALGEKRIEDCVYFKFESAIPQITAEHLDSMENINTLNDIAQKYSELSRENAAKFKAVLERENKFGLEKAWRVLNLLDSFEFDNSVNSYAEFGEQYLVKHLPPDFDRTLLQSVHATDMARKILDKTSGALTEYGAVSSSGGRLYTMVEAP
ncbi:MAG: hypothetical protein NC299_17345 [Lachnospiraceae bacterium]|nr:hypothetical protein [Ruminococcus sp.]MCM1277097.1 hypothetical protein [Lachnospiraceae bacterium]